jgi:hypothetical protein
MWWVAGPRTGVACQRQHWTSHKSQCRALAADEYRAIWERYGHDEFNRILYDAQMPDYPVLLKLSAVTWTIRPLKCHQANRLHVISLCNRAAVLGHGRPAPSDTKEGLTRLLKRATTELPWPDLPGEQKPSLTSVWRP